MFDARKLRCAVLVVTVVMLATGYGRAAESEGDGPTMEFVRIPAGTFHMGSPASEEGRHDSEGPVHEVRITKPFYMGKFEVTQAQWEAVMGTTVRQQHDKADVPWSLKGEGPEHPMYYVSWEEATEFCKRLGKNFRLPTEAEWEYACRAGSQTRFHYGDDPNYSQLDDYAWYYGKSNNETHPVGQKQPNAWGMYDIYGNVRECCSDKWYISSNYENAGSVDPTEPASTKDAFHICRGGSWLEKPGNCRSATRIVCFARTDFVGFRVVFAGRIKGDKEIVAIALPQKPGRIAPAGDDKQQKRAWGSLISGTVRDESGVSIEGVHMRSMPVRDWRIREYANGSFEICRKSQDLTDQESENYFVARHKKRNIAAAVEIHKDTSTLDVVLKSGVVLTGKVVDADGNVIEKARVRVNLKTPNWPGELLTWMETDAEGKFDIKTLPPGYDYGLYASKLHYRLGRTVVSSEDVHDNRVEGLSIVLPRGQFSVSGIVVDANGKPVADVRIWCSGADQIGINSRTDADGQFKADGIFAGKVDVMANVRGDDGKWTGGSVSVEAGATDVRVVLGVGAWAPPPKGRACFPGETGVLVDGIVVPISQVATGRAIGKLAHTVPAAPFGQIERIEKHEGVFECRDIVLDSGNRIIVVDAHCFMLDSGGWIAAQDLRDGMRLKTLNGTVGIKSVTTRATPYIGKVYNLKIANSDRYMVGADVVIVRDY